MTMHVLAVAGSLRRDSLNRRLLAAAAGCAPPGMQLAVYDGLGSIPLFSEDLEAETGGGPEPVRRLRREVGAADGLLIATPEYNQSIPGVLKNALDWLSRPAPEEVLAGKPVAVVGATVGSWGTRLAQAALRQVLTATESLVLPAPALFVRSAETLFDDAGRLRDPRTREALERLLAAFAGWIGPDQPPADWNTTSVPPSTR
jgi:chromate reductase